MMRWGDDPEACECETQPELWDAAVFGGLLQDTLRILNATWLQCGGSRETMNHRTFRADGEWMCNAYQATSTP